MRIIIAACYEDMGKKAANIVAGQIFLNPQSILGFATGSTPLSMYNHLVKMHKELDLDFNQVKTFNLDEYVGLPEKDENSYHYYMFNNLFNYINIKKENVNIPNGMAKNVEGECFEYEEKIKKAGGVDLQVLGIGNNGHIGFNEPDLKFEATTHLVKLDEETITSNSRFFKTIADVPKYAVSMGIKTIMHAKKIILLANGSSKADILASALYGSITPEVPASILQLHPDVTVIVDEAAAKCLKNTR